MVPNQPLRFTDSPDKARSEDDIIAYHARQELRHQGRHLARPPRDGKERSARHGRHSGVPQKRTGRCRRRQTKKELGGLGRGSVSVVREFLKSEAGGGVTVDKFVVAGGSKRGWTTWLVGAVDPRVMAIMPMVIDALNSEVITRDHFEAYGFFSPALKVYVNHGLFPRRIGKPEYKAVLDIEDPYNYRNRPALKTPKFLINAAGDEFFLPDNSVFYYPGLPEERTGRGPRLALKRQLGGPGRVPRVRCARVS
jgi:PhoPQ-activated pathogenicity-related protein